MAGTNPPRNPLDNPIWHSLKTRHAHLALHQGKAVRYPPAITPFVAVSEPTDDAGDDLELLIPAGERVGILSVTPDLKGSWAAVRHIDIHQYWWPENQGGELSASAVRLGAENIPAMMELTALVYPAYFRAETARLGDYYGIIVDGQLAAMAGIRMSMDGYQELSAICTHPDHRGKGYASTLTKHLIAKVVAQGDIPFLHTESDNHSAKAIYDKLGFTLRAVLPFHIVERM